MIYLDCTIQMLYTCNIKQQQNIITMTTQLTVVRTNKDIKNFIQDRCGFKVNVKESRQSTLAYRSFSLNSGKCNGYEFTADQAKALMNVLPALGAKTLQNNEFKAEDFFMYMAGFSIQLPLNS